ncbi:MAG TPA: penicillin-binding transpeptidase domain-containing protein [Kofleriaceae bacterium]
MTTRTLPRVRPMTPGIGHAARLRAYFAGAVLTAGLFGVAWRAFGLQIDQGEHYRTLAAKQHDVTVGIPAPRGDIIDTHGRPLAVSAAADSIWANPRDIRDVTDTADKLAKIIGEDPAALEAKLGGDHRFVWLERHVAPELAAKVKAAKLPGIAVDKEPRRWYPTRAVGATVIGHSDIDGNGVDGVELSMNGQLVGHRGAGQALRDVHGKKMFADGLDQPEPGATVQLSLDASLQALAESAIDDAVRVNKAKSGTVVVLEVGTGRVLAMASAPAHDPNGNENRGSSRNRAVADSYEAGSVMKLFTVASALDEGIISPDTEFDLGGGVLRLPGRATPITDVDHDPYLTVSGIIKRSSNVGAAKIALRFGAVKLYQGFKRFGFGGRSGIELPGEQAGLMRDGAKWRDVELATMAYGYGMTATPLQIAAATATFGDGGVYHEPRIVDKVIDPDGTLLYAAAPSSRQVVSAKTAAQMRAMLAGVFEGGKQAGTAASIVVPGFKCGGKTGTAHKYDPATHHYSEDHYLSVFTGLAPIDAPRLVITVLVDDPTGGEHMGAKVAGPVFAKVASEGLRYLGVPGTSDVCPPRPPGALPSIEAKTCLPAPPTTVKAAPKPVAIVAPPPAAGPPAVSDIEALDDTPDPTQLTIPEFHGMSMAKAIDTARAAHVAVELAGTGRVVEQDPAPGPHSLGSLASSAGGQPRVTLRFSDGNSPSPRGSAAPP